MRQRQRALARSQERAGLAAAGAGSGSDAVVRAARMSGGRAVPQRWSSLNRGVRFKVLWKSTQWLILGVEY